MYYSINTNRDYLKLNRSLGENPRSVLVRNICDNAKVNFISTFKNRKKLVVLPDERSAILFCEDYKFYDKNVYYFGEKDFLFEEASLDSEKIIKDRVNILKRLLNGENITVVATIGSTLEKLPTLDNLLDRVIKLKVNGGIYFEKLIERLISIGYVRVGEVEVEGEFAVRGGIIDIYDIGSSEPIRVEFVGDVIESIRHYNLE